MTDEVLSLTLPDPQGGCACTPVENPWTYYGAVEPGGALEYEPACPVHSHHFYDPKTGVWITYADVVARGEPS